MESPNWFVAVMVLVYFVLLTSSIVMGRICIDKGDKKVAKKFMQFMEHTTPYSGFIILVLVLAGKLNVGLQI
jgi:hypothetical protein